MFRLHSCASCVRPLFGAHPKFGLITFVHLHIFVAGVHLSSLPHHVSQATNFYTRVVLLVPPGVGLRIKSVSAGFTSAPKIWDTWLFLVMFNYICH